MIPTDSDFSYHVVEVTDHMTVDEYKSNSHDFRKTILDWLGFRFPRTPCYISLDGTYVAQRNVTNYFSIGFRKMDSKAAMTMKWVWK